MVYKHKIPLKNIFYMLCYAWDTLDQKDNILSDKEEFENIYDLLASVYINDCKNIIKRGLNKNYIIQSNSIPLVRGRILFNESTNPNHLTKKIIHCEHDEFIENMILNQIIVSTIFIFLKCPYLDKKLKTELGKIKIRFQNIIPIPLSNSLFNNLRFNRNNFHYKILINISELLFNGLLFNENKNNLEFAGFIKDIKMATLFEKFVLNYYKKQLPQTEFVIHSPIFEWNILNHKDSYQKHLLPIMRTDIVIDNKMKKSQLIIDAKYYAKTLVTRNYSEVEKVKQSHIYQIYAYTQNSYFEGDVNGMLLYPTTDKEVNALFPFEDHNIYIKTINLNTEWDNIQSRLDTLALI